VASVLAGEPMPLPLPGPGPAPPLGPGACGAASSGAAAAPSRVLPAPPAGQALVASSGANACVPLHAANARWEGLGRPPGLQGRAVALNAAPSVSAILPAQPTLPLHPFAALSSFPHRCVIICVIICITAVRTWLYPCDKPVRAYQARHARAIHTETLSPHASHAACSPHSSLPVVASVAAYGAILVVQPPGPRLARRRRCLTHIADLLCRSLYPDTLS
jgi:hypothetical protein